MVEVKYNGDALWARIERAVENVKIRLRRVCEALNAAEIPYAVIGGNAVQYWVAQVDESVVRNTRDVHIIINEVDLPRVKQILEGIGFVYARSSAITMFLDGPDAKAWDAVHVLFAGQKVRETDVAPVPDIEPHAWLNQSRTLPLERLVQMKLTAFRDKDRVHIRDMISINLIDDTWPERYPPVLAQRLQELLSDPEG